MSQNADGSVYTLEEANTAAYLPMEAQFSDTKETYFLFFVFILHIKHIFNHLVNLLSNVGRYPCFTRSWKPVQIPQKVHLKEKQNTTLHNHLIAL